MKRAAWLVALALLGLTTGASAAPQVDADGTLRSQSVVIPPSSLMSPQARAALALHFHEKPPPSSTPDSSIEAVRAYANAYHKPVADRWLVRYPAEIEAQTMGGVAVRVITPHNGVAPGNERRVLINLHGGGFDRGFPYTALAEAIPVAGVGRVQVVTVDYRMGPEHRFPAANEDVANVYRELLKTHTPQQIGIFGCSAGGGLTGQAVAWFQQHDLPPPGAIGIFCSGLMPGVAYGGDSTALAGVVNTDGPAAPAVSASAASASSAAPPPVRRPGYFDGVDWKDPLLSPALSPAVLARFPPTLMITGTRDFAMSNALATNARLLQAGVETQLLVLEGLGHEQYILFTETPEASLAQATIWKFFDRHLAR